MGALRCALRQDRDLEELHMTEKTCAGDGCNCTTAREDGYCSDYCANHVPHEGHDAHACHCGHAGCDPEATAA
jgi:hypothetical protein